MLKVHHTFKNRCVKGSKIQVYFIVAVFACGVCIYFETVYDNESTFR